MARQINRLNARRVATIDKPGRHADGGGLYLVVDRSGARRWSFLFRRQDRLREMGLGGIASVSLADARKLAEAARKDLREGIDPIAAKQRRKEGVPTFGQAAEDFVNAMAPAFRNRKHLEQWRTTLATYASPIRQKPVDAIGTDDVLEILKPIWLTKSETASRLRGRIERVLDATKAQGHRSGENPARWRGHLENLLPRRQKLSRGHHAAMPFADVPAFVGRLRLRDAMTARALEFLVLTAGRSGEVRGAVWSEINTDVTVWTLPAERTKAGREHRVPLSPRAKTILEETAKLGTDPDAYVFRGQKPGRPLSTTAFSMLLRRMGLARFTPHGFRSSFRDWVGEETSYPREVAEAALAHVMGSQTERSYRRGDALDKRRSLMQAWAEFCNPEQEVRAIDAEKPRD